MTGYRNHRSTNVWMMRAFFGIALIAAMCLAVGFLWRESDAPTAGPIDLSTLSQGSEAIVEKVHRSVVRVDVQRDFNATANDDADAFFGGLHPNSQQGSGIVIDQLEHVVTNFHVVSHAQRIVVRDVSGNELPARLIGADPLTDLAVLKVDGLKLPAMAWGDSSQTRSGALVWSIGSPLGYDNSVSLGIISSANRDRVLDSPFQDFLQTDAAINPGQSGGALVNARAELIGINTAISGDMFQGIGFAMPSHIARATIDEILKSGSVQRGWIGVGLARVPPEKAARAGLQPQEGALVQTLSSNDSSSPAQEAGLKVGDICLRFNQTKVNGPIALSRLIAASRVGQTIQLTIWRDGSERSVDVAIKPRPNNKYN